MESSVDGAFETYLNAGVLGATVIIFAVVIVFLWRFFTDRIEKMAKEHADERKKLIDDFTKERGDLNSQLRELEQKRLDDLRGAHTAHSAASDALREKMFDVVKQCTSVMESTAAALSFHKDVAAEHRDAQREAAEELRKLGALLAALSEEIRARFRPR